MNCDDLAKNAITAAGLATLAQAKWSNLKELFLCIEWLTKRITICVEG